MAPSIPDNAAASAPAWKNLKGMKRVQAEFKHLSKDIVEGKFEFIKELTIVNDDILNWQLKLWRFDEDCEGGRNLNKDLEQLAARYGQDHILFEITFPKDYPHQPFFIRVVSPRCVMYTGHVTAGGSICLESLTLSNTPGSWQPTYSVESLLNVILLNMIDCPVTQVQTATGPGGLSGPLRIDFNHYRPTIGYSTAEARAAFARTLENHKRLGWGGETAGGNAAGAAAQGYNRAAADAAYYSGSAAGYGGSLKLRSPGNRLGTPYVNNQAAAAAADPVAAVIERAGYHVHTKRRNNAAAAAAAAAWQPTTAAAADFSRPSAQHQSHQRTTKRPRSRSPSAVAAAGGGDTRRIRDAGGDVIVVSDSDDDAPLAPVAMAADSPVILAPILAPAAAAARGERQRQPAAAAAAPAAAVRVDMDSDVSDSDEETSHVIHLPGGTQQQIRQRQRIGSATSAAQQQHDTNSGDGAVRQQQQQQRKRRAHHADSGFRTHAWNAIDIDDVSDDDSDVAVGQVGSIRLAQSMRARAPAAAAARGAGDAAIGDQRQQRSQRQRQQQGQQQPDVILVGVHNTTATNNHRGNGVQITGSTPAQLNYAGASATAAAAAAAGLQHRPPAVQPVGDINAQQTTTAQLHQRSATVHQQFHAADGAAGARLQLHLEYPAYWDYSQPINSNTVRLVPLPLDGNLQLRPQGPTDPLEAAAAAAQLSDGDVGLLQSQGLSHQDALAALLLADGDVDEALVRATTCCDLGGCAKVWMETTGAVRHQQQMDQSAVEEHMQQQHEVTARRVAEEVEGILSMFESTGGHLTRSKVVSIERVQHARLWRRYCMRRHELIELRGEEGVNERLLFHGTSPGTADTIVQEGFDFRLVAHSSAYGNGTYFADHSSTALGYCSKPDTNPSARSDYGTGSASNNSWSAFPGAAMPPVFMPPPSSWMPPAPSGPLYGAYPPTAGTSRYHSKAAKFAAAQQLRSQQQQQHGWSRCYKMLVARVALGKQGTGQVGMRKPPEGCDSVNSGSAHVPGMAHTGSRTQGRGSSRGSAGARSAAWGGRQGDRYYCLVVFDNDQCYPEYVITFTP